MLRTRPLGEEGPVWGSDDGALAVGQACGLQVYLSQAVAAIVLGLALAVSPAEAEMQIGVYGGWSESFDSDIHLSQPGGTNLTLSDVPWEGEFLRSSTLLGPARHLLA